MSLKTVASGRRDIFMIAAKDISILDGYNLRESLPQINVLAASIRANGFYPDKPLRVSVDDDLIVVRDGHRRLAAVMDIDCKMLIPCVAELRGMTVEDRIVAQIVSADGVPLTPLEEARGFKGLRASGWSYQRIAERIGRSHVHVRERLALLDAPPELVVAVEAGDINVSTARGIARVAKTDPDAARVALDVAKSTSRPSPRSEKSESPRVRALSVAEISTGIDAADKNEHAAKTGSRDAAYWRGVADGLRVAARLETIESIQVDAE